MKVTVIATSQLVGFAGVCDRDVVDAIVCDDCFVACASRGIGGINRETGDVGCISGDFWKGISSTIICSCAARRR